VFYEAYSVFVAAFRDAAEKLQAGEARMCRIVLRLFPRNQHRLAPSRQHLLRAGPGSML
jgi:hypothetical protein